MDVALKFALYPKKDVLVAGEKTPLAMQGHSIDSSTPHPASVAALNRELPAHRFGVAAARRMRDDAAARDPTNTPKLEGSLK